MAGSSIIWDLISEDRASATNAKVGRSFEELDGKTSNLGATFGKVAGAAKYLGGAVGAAGALAVVSGVKTLASLETTTVGFTTLLGSAKKANDYITWMKKFAAATPFDLAGLTDSARLLIGVGVSAKESKVILQDFGDTAGAVGMDSQHFSMAMLAVSQSISAGHIKLGDMNQLMNDGIPIWKLLSEAMGKPVPALQAMISKGQLLSKDVMPKLLSAMHKDYGGSMAKQSATLTGLWSTLMDTINLGMADALLPFEGELKSGLTAAINVAGAQLRRLPTMVHDVEGAFKAFHLGSLIGGAIGTGKSLSKDAAAWGTPIIQAIESGIEHGDWTGLMPVLSAKLKQLGGASGSGVGSIVTAVGGWLAGVDWMKVGMSIGKTLAPLSLGIVTTFLDGLITAFKRHPFDTVVAIASIIPIGRVAGLVGDGLKPGILKGVLNALKWAGSKVEGPTWTFLKFMGRAFLDGLDRVLPELRSGTRGLIESGILRVLYAAEHVKAAAQWPFKLIGSTAGKMVGYVVKAMKLVGHDAVGGLVRGIEAEGSAVIHAISGIADDIPSAMKKILDIHSPSRVMAALGGQTMQGFINGIRGKKKDLHAAMEDVKDVLSKDITKWNSLLDTQKSKLSDLKSAYSDLKSSIASAFSGTSITDRGSSLAQVFGSYGSNITQGGEAASALKRLKKLGLRSDLLAQLAQGGAGSLGLEQQILHGGSAAVKKLNADQKTLVGIGNSVGTTVANATYAKAIALETKKVEKLTKGVDDLKKALEKVEVALRNPHHINAAALRAALYKLLRQAGATAGK